MHAPYKSPAPPPPGTVLYLRGIDQNLKALFKAYCAKRGTTMHDVMRKFMEDCIARDRPRETPPKRQRRKV